MGGEEVGGKGLGVKATGSCSSKKVGGDTEGGGHSPIFCRYYTVTLFSQPDDLFALALLSPFWDFKNNSILIRARNPVLYLRCNFGFVISSDLHVCTSLYIQSIAFWIQDSIPVFHWVPEGLLSLLLVFKTFFLIPFLFMQSMTFIY